MKHSMDSLRKAQTNSNRTMATLTLAMTFMVIAFVSALSTGKYPITLSGLAAGDPMALRTFTVLRLPRAVMGLVGGFGLGIAGFVYQTVFRNPLASPDIIGVSSGASAGAAFAILFVSAAAPSTTLFAFFGALLAVCLSLGLTALSPVRDHSSIVLAGIAVHALAQTVLMLLKLMADPEKQLASIEYWIMGSLSGVTASKIPFPVVIILISSALVFLLHRHLLVLSVREDEARMLGVSVRKTRFFVLFLATLTVAAAVSVTGLISFVGLLAPHTARLLTGHNREVRMLSQRSHREFPAPDRGYSCKITRRSGASCQYLYFAPRSAVFDLSDPLGKEALIIMSEHVSIQDLSVSLGGHQILNHLSLSVENPGHMIALLGPNGSGKTTLLRAICGELSHSGHVLLNGQDLTALSPKALAGLVSYIPQQSGISISMSALDVVLMGFYSRLKLFEQPSAKMREAALQALASVGMDDFANRDYLTLSGGEQQLVILARTLIEDTSLLLFDEPDSSLDFGNKYRMMGLIADIVQAAQGGRSASPAFFTYKKRTCLDTFSHWARLFATISLFA